MIPSKKKICKGNWRTGHFKGCGEEKYIKLYGLCSSCTGEWMHNTELGKIKLSKMAIAAKKKVKSENKKKEKIENTDWNKKLQSRINEIARLIDIGLSCLARGYHADQMHGGHIFSRGSNQTIRFNLHNIHRQSAQSNHFQNEDGLLREGLINEYGEKYYKFIGELRQTPAIKYTNEELHIFYKKADSIAKELKKQGNTFNLKERLEMRNRINYELGIYEDKYCFY